MSGAAPVEVILTHEHADFDAIASQVALARLRPGAVAVQPGEVNQNVRDFLTLFGGELPLVKREDLPRQAVAAVWVVDAATAQMVRGVDATTVRRVIDHHTARVDGALDGDGRGGSTGANVTLLVERLAAAGVAPTPLEATLYILGIYEDTGSLTFAGTTARDLRAAAWLLERGADLDTARQFLGAPLSPEEERLLAALRAAAAPCTPRGRHATIAAVEAPDYGEEVSRVATLLTDALGTEALVVLVRSGSRVHVVARSTTSGIDVGAMARELGGGGHARAAAAVLEHTSLADAEAAVRRALEGAARPATTVAEIMSRGEVRTLDAGMTVDEAEVFARLHGHEGYPVLDDGRVVGVVTRRDLDRAARHGLGAAPVSRVAAGPPPAVPADMSVESLQQVMVDAHVGQLPVVSGGRVVGIVTRTDLMKLWADRARGAAPIRVDLDAAFAAPMRAAVAAIAAQARALGMRVFVVGGVPRDLLLGVTPGPDVDIVVEGDAIALAREVAAHHGGHVTAHDRFGTAKWIRPGATSVDMVSARTEFYAAPTALPGVERGSLQSDLRRRDFTINTLAADIDPERYGEVIDLFGGISDLRARRIRVLHSLSFVEDPTRILRAARLAARLGFTFEERTAEQVGLAVDLLARVSPARIRNELVQLFAEPEPDAALALLADVGALRAIHPGAGPAPEAVRAYETLAPALALWRDLIPATARTLPAAPRPADGLVLWVAAHGEAADALAGRLGLPRVETARAHAVREVVARGVPGRVAEPGAVELYRAFNGLPGDVRVLAWAATADADLKRALRRHHVEVAPLRLSLSGTDLQAAGFAPGPEFATALEAALEAYLSGEAPDGAAQLAVARRVLEGGD